MTFKYLPNDGHITSLRSLRLHPNTKKRTMHEGVDFSGISGSDDIIAIGNGRVRIAEYQSGYGNVIVITHPATKSTGNIQFESLYAHLARINVKVGQEVNAGEIVGQKGNTGKYGNSKHLHFELFTPKFSSNFSTAVDPLLYISSPLITELQVKLKRVGESVEIDGYFGKDTMNAIKRFQKKHNLEIDGYCGLSTKKVLDSMQNTTEEPPKQVASDNKPSTPQPHKDGELFYSSPSLQSIVEDILKNDTDRKLIVSEAIKSGANEKVWIDKLNNNTISDLDIMGLAMKHLVDSNRNK